LALSSEQLEVSWQFSFVCDVFMLGSAGISGCCAQTVLYVQSFNGCSTTSMIKDLTKHLYTVAALPVWLF